MQLVSRHAMLGGVLAAFKGLRVVQLATSGHILHLGAIEL
jgi:hypothetical protein